MSSLLPEDSRQKENSKIPICYGVQCDSTKKQIIVKIGTKNVICPEQGGEIENPSGFNGILECPKYNDICSPNDDFVCNEIFSCIDESVKKNNFNYKIDYYDYEGPTTTYLDIDEDDGEDEDEDEDDEDNDNDNDDIDIIRRSNGFNINIDFALLITCLIIFIC